MKWLRRIAALAVIAVAANVVTTWALPWVVNAVVLHGITDRILARAQSERHSSNPSLQAFARQALARGGKNVAVHVAPITAASRVVVRPSPDLLYTACVFDLSRHPLRIHAVAASGYVSVSGFGPGTRNFFVRDVEPGAGGTLRVLDLILVHGPIPTHLPAGVTVVRAPSTRGLVLFRTLITDPDPSAVQTLRQLVQLQQSCTPVLKS